MTTRWIGVAALLALAGCRDDACAPADLSPPPRLAAYAVVSSDYASTAIALLDADGALLDEAFVDSGTAPPGVVATLNGDVVLASAPLAPCVITVVDRFLTDVVTFLDACRGGVIAQLHVGVESSTNPHDVIALDADRALVSRHDPARAGGNDLAIVDWRAARVASTIDLSSFDVDVTVGEERVRTFARPSRMARLVAGDTARVIVGLARLDASFMISGPGGVAVVDVGARTAVLFPIEGLTGCGEVDAVPGRADLAVVTCGGPTFSDEPARREASGVVVVALAPDGAVAIRSIWRARDHPDEPVYAAWAVPLDADRVVVTAMGDRARGIDDRVGVLSMGDGAAPLLMEADDAFAIGDGAYDPERGLLLVPDAAAAVVRRFVRDGGSFVEIDAVDTPGCRGLEPREVRPLSAP